MEIRRIEGIIPLDGVSRDLPKKLENFSYHDMKKLLSTISAGAQKKDMEEELSSLLIRATFEGFTPEGKAKLRSGQLLLVADVEVDRDFKIGEELLFRLKSLHPRIELSLVREEELLSKLKSLLSRFSEEKLFLSLKILKSHPKLKEELSSGFNRVLFSPFSLLSLLLLLEEDEKKLPEGQTRDSLREIIPSFLSVYALFVLGGVLIFPFLFDEGFKGKVYFSHRKEDVHKVYVEVETRLGKLGLFIQLLSENVSVEAVTESEELLKVLERSREDIKKGLEEEGFKLVFFRISPDLSYGEEKKREVFKGEKGIAVNFSA